MNDDNHLAFHIEAVQPSGSKGDPDLDENLLDWSGNVLFERKDSTGKQKLGRCENFV